MGASDPTNLAYLQRVQALVDQLGLSERVRWTGFTAAAEVSANFFASDIAVLPYRDGASFRRGSLMAAIAHGMPVISTEPTGHVPDMLHGQNIWLTPREAPRRWRRVWKHCGEMQRCGARWARVPVLWPPSSHGRALPSATSRSIVSSPTSSAPAPTNRPANTLKTETALPAPSLVSQRAAPTVQARAVAIPLGLVVVLPSSWR